MVQIFHIITGLNNGGAEASLFRLITHDVQNTHVVISMMDEGKYGKPLQELGIAVNCLNMPRGKITYKGLSKLWYLLKNSKPDVVQTWMYHADLIGGIVAKSQAIPCVWSLRNSDLSPQKTSFSTRAVVRLCAFLSLLLPTKIISCAQQAAIVHQKIGYKKNKFITIPNGYNFHQFRVKEADINTLSTSLNLPDTFPILGLVARFDPQKDHHNLIQALKIVSEQNVQFHCLLVGKDISPNNQKLFSWIEQAGLIERISLLEQRDDIPLIMHRLDIHTSSSYGEAFPNVLAEAMVCGTPCVTTDVGDAALIVGNTGWVVPPSNSQALANAILTALKEKEENPNAWQTRKQAARQHIVDNFGIERMVAAYNQVWLETKK
jgi:glycosyltransferase involved in cell wall biosynthesis